MSALVALAAPTLSAQQRAMIALIEARFLAAGWGLPVAAGAAVNAYAESRLNPSAQHASMYGLFQADNKYGAGIGKSAAELLHPSTNIDVILGVLKGRSGNAIRAAWAAGERRPARFAYLFCRDVERPKDASMRAEQREGLTYSVFPGLVQAGDEPSLGGAVADAMVGVTPQQREMAALIEERLGRAGLPNVIIIGAIINALAESGLNPKAIGHEDNGTLSVGLFQLNDRGAGSGMSVAERQDPMKNTERILRVYREGAGRRLEEEYQRGNRDPGVMAALWCIYLERPRDAQNVGLARRARTYKHFPSSVLLLIPEHRRGRAQGTGGPSPAPLVGLLLVAGAVLLATTGKGRRP